MKNYKKNLNLNYIYELCLNCRFTQLLWPTYMIIMGYSLVEVGMAESLFHATSLVCEIPTGMISDLYGRKTSRLLGRLLNIVDILLLAFATNIWMVYLSFIISAIAYTLESGTDSAYVYDLMLENKDEQRFAKVQGYREVIFQVGSFIGIIMGGFIADYSYRLAYILSIIMVLLTIIILMQTSEIRHNEFKKVSILKAMKHQYTTSFQLLKENNQIISLILSYSLFSATITTCHFYITNFLKDYGLSMSKISFVLALENIAGVAAGLYAYKLIQRYSKYHVALILPLFIVIGLMGVPFFPISLIAMIFIGFIETLLYVSITTFLNEMIPSSSRATLLSCNSMVFSFVMIIYFPFVGLMGQLFGLKLAFIALSILMIIVYIIYQKSIRNVLKK